MLITALWISLCGHLISMIKRQQSVVQVLDRQRPAEALYVKSWTLGRRRELMMRGGEGVVVGGRSSESTSSSVSLARPPRSRLPAAEEAFVMEIPWMEFNPENNPEPAPPCSASTSFCFSNSPLTPLPHLPPPQWLQTGPAPVHGSEGQALGTLRGWIEVRRFEDAAAAGSDGACELSLDQSAPNWTWIESDAK